MSEKQSNKISCAAAVYSAWDRMENLLFRPFDMGRWFVLGFAAWIANIGQGGFNSGFSIPQNPDFSSLGGGQAAPGSSAGIFRDLFHNGIFSTTVITLLCILVLVVLVLSISIMLVLLWVRSRGAFVFVHDLVTSTTQIKFPWEKYSRQGNSLFVFRIVAGVLISFAAVLFIGAAVLMLLPSIMHAKLDALGIAGIIFGVLSLLLVVFAAVIIELSIDGFIVPMMFRNMCTSWDALAVLASLVNTHPSAFIRFFLMYFLLSICAATAVAVFLVSTCCFCCIGFIILSLPYLWAVAMLPILVFFRYYSIDFLAQFGDEYRLIAGNKEPVNADI